mgnify:CR=1 FL=1
MEIDEIEVEELKREYKKKNQRKGQEVISNL